MRVSSGPDQQYSEHDFRRVLADVRMLACTGDTDAMEKMIQLNLNTPMRLCHHLSKPMVEAKKGVIIDISSVVRLEADIALLFQ